MTISLVTYPLQMVFLEGGFYFARQVAEHKMISDVHSTRLQGCHLGCRSHKILKQSLTGISLITKDLGN